MIRLVNSWPRMALLCTPISPRTFARQPHLAAMSYTNRGTDSARNSINGCIPRADESRQYCKSKAVLLRIARQINIRKQKAIMPFTG